MSVLKSILGLILLSATCAVAVEAPESPQLHLVIDSVEPIGISEEGTALARVFFKVHTAEEPGPDTIWTRNVEEHTFRQLHLDGFPASFLAPPDRVQSETRPAPMVFLLAIDVSGSMGGFGSWRGLQDYDRRMEPLRSALLGFIEGNVFPHVYVRLYPFGHLVPHPVGVEFSPQDLEVWQGRFLSLSGDGAKALEQGVKDIDTFVRDGDRAVDTALFATYLEGVRELNEAASISDFQGAKRVLILLTDGMNDPRRAPEPYRSLGLDDVLQGLAADGSPAVYTIGFGLDDPATLQSMENVAGLGNAHFIPVAGGEDAESALKAAYDDVVEVEGRSWYVDVDTGKSRKQVALEGTGISVGDAPPMNDRMLLLPSAGIVISTRYRLIALDLIGLAIAVLLTAWFLLNSRRETAESEATERGEGENDGAPAKVEPVRISGMSVQEWRRRQEAQREVKGDD